MSRRIAMRSVVLAVVAVAAWCGPAAAHHRGPARSSDFGAGWKFLRGDPAGAQDPAFDDSAWRGVELRASCPAGPAGIARRSRCRATPPAGSCRSSSTSPEMIEVCQELGIVMMVEAFDVWRTRKATFDYARFFDANSDADIKEMVDAAKNSPAVIMWSIGNEIPDSTSATVGLPIAQRLIDDIRSIDTSRPIVIGSDRYRSLPRPGSGAEQILGLLDGLGLNYNTAASVDALHATYPDKFLFESESSSEESTRGVYQDPDYLNTGENDTPGKRGTSFYDNNLASWTMSGELRTCALFAPGARPCTF